MIQDPIELIDGLQGDIKVVLIGLVVVGILLIVNTLIRAARKRKIENAVLESRDLLHEINNQIKQGQLVRMPDLKSTEDTDEPSSSTPQTDEQNNQPNI